ncbi:ribokinase [Lutimonas sp.]|uniref:ribokinase n=1 Tax=Lutimonas sp. TaxID=1872403 RepID=UPI003D9B60D6
MKKKIVVVGSCNTDLVIRTSSFPKPGETVMGSDFNIFAGGKGANQAVAASRLGADVVFVTRVGDDSFGNTAIQGFKKEGMLTDYVFKDTSHPSGVATITLNESGENSIIVAPGANNALTKENVASIKEELRGSEILLVQLEVPLPSVLHAIELAHSLHKKVILNPAPACELPKEVYGKINVITPNETEAFLLTGVDVVDESSASRAAAKFLGWGVKHVVITMGEKGVFFKDAADAYLMPAIKTNVQDTTAAGDIFNGALAVGLAEGESWSTALKFANIAASIGVSRLGAQASIPFREEVLKYL